MADEERDPVTGELLRVGELERSRRPGQDSELTRSGQLERRHSPTTTIVSQLSPQSRDTLGRRLAQATSRVYRGAQPPTGFEQAWGATSGMVQGGLQTLGGARQFVDEQLESNPYGGYPPQQTQQPRRGFTGDQPHPGYFGEVEFEDPFTGDTQFYAGDAKVRLRNMDPGVLTRVQERLDALGFMSGTWVPGAADTNTEQAFESLLAESNRRGTSWQQTLNQIEQMMDEMGLLEAEEGGGGAERTFRPPAYMAPDYATLAQHVKGQMRSVLGRDPDESEMAQLTAELSGWDRAAYDAEVGAQRAQFEGGGEATTVQSVDPAARFKEVFEKKFEHEIDFVEDKETAVESREIVEGGVGTLSQMSQGRGV